LKEVTFFLPGDSIPSISGIEPLSCFVVAQVSSDVPDELAGKPWLSNVNRLYWFREDATNQSDALVSTKTLIAIGEMTRLQRLELGCDSDQRTRPLGPVDQKAWRQAFDRKPALVDLELLLPINDEAIAALPTIPSLQTIDLNSESLTLDGIARMQPQPRLKSLSVSNWELGVPVGTLPVNVSRIAPRLEELSLRISMSDQQLESLNPPVSLQGCHLYGDDLTGSSLAVFADCKNLEYLTFRSQYGAFDPESRPAFDLQSLPRLPALNRLEIRRRHLGSSDLRSLVVNCPALTMLELSECHFDEDAIFELSELKSLEWFMFRGSNLGDEVVSLAGQMPRLRILVGDGSSMTPAGRDANRRLQTARNQPKLLDRIGKSYLSSPLLRTKDGKPPIVRR